MEGELANCYIQLLSERFGKMGLRMKQMRIIDENGMMQVEYMKFKSPGLMELHVDNLTSDTISLANNGKQNGI